MQNFDPVALTARVSQLEKIIFGHDVPDYVTPPTDENPHPPIRQVQGKNLDGSPKVDRYGQPVLVDCTIHKPGLLDEAGAQKAGVPLAGEGGATNPSQHQASKTPAKGSEK